MTLANNVAKPRGKLSTAQLRREAQYTIDAAARPAADYLSDIANRRIEKPSRIRVDVCEYILNHAMGKPVSKIEHSGSISAERPLQSFTTDELRQLRLELVRRDGSSAKATQNDDATHVLEDTRAREQAESAPGSALVDDNNPTVTPMDIHTASDEQLGAICTAEIDRAEFAELSKEQLHALAVERGAAAALITEETST